MTDPNSTSQPTDPDALSGSWAELEGTLEPTTSEPVPADPAESPATPDSEAVLQALPNFIHVSSYDDEQTVGWVGEPGATINLQPFVQPADGEQPRALLIETKSKQQFLIEDNTLYDLKASSPAGVSLPTLNEINGSTTVGRGWNTPGEQSQSTDKIKSIGFLLTDEETNEQPVDQFRSYDTPSPFTQAHETLAKLEAISEDDTKAGATPDAAEDTAREPKPDAQPTPDAAPDKTPKPAHEDLEVYAGGETVKWVDNKNTPIELHKLVHPEEGQARTQVLIDTEDGNHFLIRDGVVYDLDASKAAGELRGVILDEVNEPLDDFKVGDSWQIPGYITTEKISQVGFIVADEEKATLTDQNYAKKYDLDGPFAGLNQTLAEVAGLNDDDAVRSLPTPEAVDPKDSVFEQARHTEKQLTNEQIIGLFRGSFVVGDRNVRDIKDYFDQQPLDEGDKAFMASPEKMTQFHTELGEFITERMTMFVKEPSPGTEDTLRKYMDGLVERIGLDNATVSDYMQQLLTANDTAARNALKPPSDDMKFHRMVLLPTDSDELAALSEAMLDDVQQNISVQITSSCFVHYMSERYIQAKLDGEQPEIAHRIYLNPDNEAAVRIFAEVVDAAETAGIAMTGKIYDRSGEAVNNLRHEKNTNRGDGLVFYAGEHSDALLKIVDEVYQNNQAVFAGRRLSGVPHELGPGFGIGDEPVQRPARESASLTSDRADFFDEVERAVLIEQQISDFNALDDTQQQAMVSRFRAKFVEMAPARGINPYNYAFNAR